MTVLIDAADRKILRLLQNDCRQPFSEVANAVGMSKSACHRRIQILEEKGVIDRYTAVLKPETLGYVLMFVVDVTLKGQSDVEMEKFEKAVLTIAEILECQLMTGQNDYVLRVAARSVEDYEETHHRLARLPGVAKLNSSLALRTVKQVAGFPL